MTLQDIPRFPGHYPTSAASIEAPVASPEVQAKASDAPATPEALRDTFDSRSDALKPAALQRYAAFINSNGSVRLLNQPTFIFHQGRPTEACCVDEGGHLPYMQYCVDHHVVKANAGNILRVAYKSQTGAYLESVFVHELTHAAQHQTYPDMFRQAKEAGRELSSSRKRYNAWFERQTSRPDPQARPIQFWQLDSAWMRFEAYVVVLEGHARFLELNYHWTQLTKIIEDSPHVGEGLRAAWDLNIFGLASWVEKKLSDRKTRAYAAGANLFQAVHDIAEKYPKVVEGCSVPLEQVTTDALFADPQLIWDLLPNYPSKSLFSWSWSDVDRRELNGMMLNLFLAKLRQLQGDETA